MASTQSHYLGHLTEVNKRNKVLISEDVFNQRGVLVVKKGAEVDPELAQKVAKHKLSKPLDHSISLTVTINQRTSLDFFARRLEDMQLSQIVRNSVLFLQAQEHFHWLTQYPMVTQKITVLAERLPDIFSRSLMTSVMALGLCKELKLSNQITGQVFLANMMSDLGLLHIDPKIVNKQGQYNEQELKMMQGHVVISKHFADMVPDLPKVISRAILEHHERADGLGYPFGKLAPQLGLEGQILAMVDKVSGIYRKLVKNGPHSWTALLAVVQVPSTAHLADVHSATMRFLKVFALDYVPAFSEPEFKDLLLVCLEKRERLNLWFKEFARIYVDHKTLLTDSTNFKPLALLQQLEYTVVDSGVLSKAQHKWLSGLRGNIQHADFRDVEEFALVLDEVEYHCFFVMRQLVLTKDDVVKRFGDEELPSLYYQGLINLLDPDEMQRII